MSKALAVLVALLLFSLNLKGQSPYEKKLEQIFLNVPVAKLTNTEIKKLKSNVAFTLTNRYTFKLHNMVSHTFALSKHDYFSNSTGGELIIIALPDSFKMHARSGLVLNYKTKKQALKDFNRLFKELESVGNSGKEKAEILQDSDDKDFYTYTKKIKQVKGTVSGIKLTGQWLLNIEYDYD